MASALLERPETREKDPDQRHRSVRAMGNISLRLLSPTNLYRSYAGESTGRHARRELPSLPKARAKQPWTREDARDFRSFKQGVDELTPASEKLLQERIEGHQNQFGAESLPLLTHNESDASYGSTTGEWTPSHSARRALFTKISKRLGKQSRL